MLNIRIQSIPKSQSRYETVGDWKFNEWGDLEVKVVEMGNWKYELLVAIHEVIEAFLCKDKNVKEEDITAFDIAFEKRRKKGNTDEPGDDPKAPYRRQHFIATNIERMLSDCLEVDWKEYDKKVMSL